MGLVKIKTMIVRVGVRAGVGVKVRVEVIHSVASMRVLWARSSTDLASGSDISRMTSK